MKIMTNIKSIDQQGRFFRGESELEDGRFYLFVPDRSTQNNDTISKLKIRWTGPELLRIDHAQLVLQADNARITFNPSATFSQHLIDTQITSDNNDFCEHMDYVIDKAKNL